MYIEDMLIQNPPLARDLNTTKSSHSLWNMHQKLPLRRQVPVLSNVGSVAVTLHSKFMFR